MKSINIGQRLKEARQSRNLTLDDAAALTGVSKPMLGQIERGQSSPTVNTLWKIATGLKIPFSAFLQSTEAGYTVNDLKNLSAVTEENGKMRAYTVLPFDPERGCEAFYIEFDAECTHHSPAHGAGVEEHIFVLEGSLEMKLNGTRVVLCEKQSLRFAACIPHSYCSRGDGMCTIYNTIFYRESSI